MKKFYGIKNLKYKRYIEEKLAKIRYLLQMYSHNRSYRICAKANYRELIHDENESFNVPHDIRFNPTVIVIYDLIPKSELKEFMKGWQRLSIKCSTPKFTSNISKNDVSSYIKGLQYNLSLKNWLDVGLFNIPNMDTIKYFDFRIYNFSTSLCALRFSVYLSKEFQYKCHELFISKCRNSITKGDYDYINQKKHYRELFTSIDSIKHRNWCELIAKLKWSFLHFINKILKIHLIFFNHNIESPSVLMIDTHIRKINIPKDMNIKQSLKFDNKYKGYIYFKYATGWNNAYSINKNESMSFSNRPYYNVQYFYNSKGIKINDENILIMARESLLDNTGKLLCLDISNDIRRKYTYIYVTCVDKIKMKWRKYKRILKEKFKYQNKVASFNIIKNEINWLPIVKIYNLMWPKVNTYSDPYILYSPKILVGTLNTSKILDYLINKENKRINNKIFLLKDLSEQKQNHKRSMLIFTVLAFIISILALLGDLNVTTFEHNITNIIKFIWHL